MDYIILDTPPMLAAADAETLARFSDTALLVVRSDFMPVSSINQGLDRLRAAAPDFCGVVLNNHWESFSIINEKVQDENLFLHFFLLCKFGCDCVRASRKTQSFTEVNSFVFLLPSLSRLNLLRRSVL